MIHTPVLLNEAVESLDPQRGETFIDATAGAGGHAKAIGERIGEDGKLMLVDWDEETVRALEKVVRAFSNARVVLGNYADIPELMTRFNFPKPGMLLIDLGFSSDQLSRGRGFSFQPSAKNEPLLMTYSDKQIPLKDLLSRMSEKEIFQVIGDYGEERFAKKIASEIFARRGIIKTSGDLVEAIFAAIPKGYERGKIHPATRTFQALRIYANQELENLKKILEALPKIMNAGGRAAVISFHSLEDGIVKEAFHNFEKEKLGKCLNKKPIQAGFEEVARNPRSRSAKLRVFKLF